MRETGSADPGLPDEFLTLAGPGGSEIKIQRSRFLGFAAPAPDETAAREFLADLTRRYHDARHHCSAWRLGRPPSVQEVRNDAGEPAGTAGEPILAALRRIDVSDAACVVVRYFGGVKLGTGGLARAYGEAAAAAVAAAGTRTILLGRRFALRFPYAQQRTVSHLLVRHGGRVEQEEFAAEVRWIVWLPHSCWRGFASALTEATAAAVTADPLPDP
ncbi:MAG: YigZ family protein [Candidatus Krumholzibacteriia bacterium]